LHFIQVTLFCKNKRALAFNRDRCCHLALCLQLNLFNCNIARLFCARILPPSCLGHLRWHDTDRIISVSVVLPKLGRASRGQNYGTELTCEFAYIFAKKLCQCKNTCQNFSYFQIYKLEKLLICVVFFRAFFKMSKFMIWWEFMDMKEP
jgi:hypothetical protein